MDCVGMSVRADTDVRIHHNLVLSDDIRLWSMCVQSAAPTYALILLNNALPRKSLIERLWLRCALVLCADGAARRVRDMQLRRHADIAGSAEECIPDAIVGDMDSLDVETCEYYRARGVPISRVEDQGSTDLDKCLHYASQRQAGQGVSVPYRVLICGCFGGRFDHELGALHSMCLWNQHFSSIQLVDDNNMCTVLGRGAHYFLPVTGVDGGHCGLVPVEGPVRMISTQVCNKISEEAMYRGGDHDDIVTGRMSSVVTRSIATANELCYFTESATCLKEASLPGVFVCTTDPVIWTNSISISPPS